MHEFSIAEGLIDIIKDTAKTHGLRRVEKIQLRIGALRQVAPEALRFAFEALGKDTVAEGAEITIAWVPAKARCDGCGGEFTADDCCFICTSCGSGDVTVIEGKELFIDSLEGE